MRNELQTYIETVIGSSIIGIFPGSGRIRATSGKSYFLKSGPASETFRCEANGLKELEKTGAIEVARVVAMGDTFILTEWIEEGRPTVNSQAVFGKRLAQMHRFEADVYGFYEDNFIGANPQPNQATGDEQNNWAAFFYNKRLLFQYRMAEQQGLVSNMLQSGFRRLETRIASLLDVPSEKPALLHGDLWSGNYLYDREGQAVLIDPAVYYGHREADLAMTRLFGGFSTVFYQAYQEEYPLAEGWEQREGVYKLYHVLNHLNIFGRGYLGEAEHLLSVF